MTTRKTTKKALILTTVASTIDQFCMKDIAILHSMGIDVHVAANFESGGNTSPLRVEEFKEELREKKITWHHVPMSRQPLQLANWRVYKEIVKMLRRESFDVLHCHTPIAALIGRTAAQNVNKINVIYTAHGFHFYRGAPLLNWMLYYPIEKWLAPRTDHLITINQEDFEFATQHLKTNVHSIPGVGVDLSLFDKSQLVMNDLRSQLSLHHDDTYLLSVGELNENKNHRVVIEALHKINDPSLHYLICGQGAGERTLQELIRTLGLENNVHLLGYQPYVNNYYAAADVFVFPSKREGLSVALMEAMAYELPIIASRIRGNVDLIDDPNGGRLVDTKADSVQQAILDVLARRTEWPQIGQYNRQKVQYFSNADVEAAMRNVYLQIVHAGEEASS